MSLAAIRRQPHDRSCNLKLQDQVERQLLQGPALQRAVSFADQIEQVAGLIGRQHAVAPDGQAPAAPVPVAVLDQERLGAARLHPQDEAELIEEVGQHLDEQFAELAPTIGAGPEFGPLWYPLTLVAIALPCAFVGGRLAERRQGTPTDAALA